ncbi:MULTISPECIES: copper-containing nitrite reductase [Halocynthiibacter]|uniref:Copper-containing nitrite reductase n=1 Tax=Halocynthiibacter halioticoli TaxID=2986804 RepID=A0AAE3IYC0_9RHOB|nr:MULTISPECIES: copper-containing nitrite reductase [Halocynthiibacter]MCV6823370.1 copper-containing nitrite reductase [Halocynthiibacter halioticoli]MCW4056371.1 copper-containing nitrite reductase [Halocynthiibacter sp. SDUM655004]
MTASKKIGFKPSRRSVLTGSALAGAAMLSGAVPAMASARRAAPKLSKTREGMVLPVAEKQEVSGKAVDLSHLPRVKQEMVMPPFAPEHDQVATGGPKIVEVRFDIEEKLMTVDEDTDAKVWALTYNGSVPGPLIIVHEGDYVELTLSNPESSVFEHNIDFHSSTGALGGGGLTHVLPGEETVLRWKATKPGVFVYHCAPGGAMIPYHVCKGMNGAVMVLPRDGLKDGEGNPLRYDEIAYIGEQDYYLPMNEDGEYIQYEDAGEDYSDALDAMRGLIPTHSVFNGAVGALTGENALKSKVGNTVLMIHAQANRDTRPHLIGGHADYLWEGGSFTDAPQTGFETWFIRGGSAGAAMYTFLQPGVYAYVNHNLIEATLLGASAHFVVEGEWDNELMEQVVAPQPIGS